MKRRPDSHSAPRDWAAVRQRLAEILQATERAIDLTPAAAAARVEEWTRRFATPMDSTAPERATHELVFIRVGTEGYAIPSDVVREIVGHYTLEALPGAPAPFVGLLAHRGQLLPVVDAATLLDQPSGRGHAEQVLVLGRHAPEIALLVSRVEAIRRVPDTELRRPPGSGEEHRLVRRLTTDAVAVIDGLRLLDDPRIAPGHTEGNGASKHPDANSRGEGSCE